MLLDKSIPSQDGERKLDLNDQMRIIVEELGKKKRDLESRRELHKFPFGIKIIYCTPRSIPKDVMKRELQDCIKLKLAFPDLICGTSSLGILCPKVSHLTDGALRFRSGWRRG